MSDLIKREDAIEAIHNYWEKRLDTLPTTTCEYGEVYADIQQIDKILEHNKTLCSFIKSIPSAERKGEWIPCSERLPSEQGQYLVTTYAYNDYHYVDVLSFHKGKFYETDSEWGDMVDNDVVAWMPLPKPYGERKVKVMQGRESKWILLREDGDILRLECPKCRARIALSKRMQRMERTRWKCCPICLTPINGWRKKNERSD